MVKKTKLAYLKIFQTSLPFLCLYRSQLRRPLSAPHIQPSLRRLLLAPPPPVKKSRRCGATASHWGDGRDEPAQGTVRKCCPMISAAVAFSGGMPPPEPNRRRRHLRSPLPRSPPSTPHQSSSPRCRCFSSSPTRKYAVLGSGFAGLSVVWHLLQVCFIITDSYSS